MARRKSVTLKDIAERLDVSPTAVSAALSNRHKGVWVSEATRRSIVETAKEMGYELSPRAVVSRRTPVRTGSVAVLCLPWYDPLFGKTVSELCRTLGEWGLHPFIHVSPDRAASCAAGVQLHRQGRAEALILLGSRSHPEELDFGDVPYVVIGEVPSGRRVWQVCVHNRHGGRLVGEHLWQLGHRRVGVVTLADALFAEEEVFGLRCFWEECGLPLPERHVLSVGENLELGDALPDFLRQIVEREGEPLTALFCAGDVLAAHALTALKENGWRVPEEISLVGFDDSPLLAENLDPPLTTVRQPFVQLGHVAAQLLHECMEQPTAEPRRILLPGELVARRSSAPLSPLRAAVSTERR